MKNFMSKAGRISMITAYGIAAAIVIGSIVAYGVMALGASGVVASVTGAAVGVFAAASSITYLTTSMDKALAPPAHNGGEKMDVSKATHVTG